MFVSQYCNIYIASVTKVSLFPFDDERFIFDIEARSYAYRI